MAKVSSPAKKKQGSPSGAFCHPNCTPLCPKSECTHQGKHHEIIMSLVKCTNRDVGDPARPDFIKCLDKYKKTKWFLKGAVPDKSERLHFPLVHWACMLGKYKLLEYLVSERSFDLTVKGGMTQDGPLHSLIVHLNKCLNPKSSCDYVGNIFGSVFDVFLKNKPEILHKTDAKSKDTILHFCARRCTTDSFARKYMKVILAKIKECEAIPTPKKDELLNAVNTRGDNFLHLLVADEKSVETLVYMVENFGTVADAISKTKNHLGKTPRQIAVEKQSFLMLKALGAPDVVINSLQKAVKSGRLSLNNKSPRLQNRARKSATIPALFQSTGSDTGDQENAPPNISPAGAGLPTENGVSSLAANRSAGQDQNSQLTGDTSNMEQSNSSPSRSDSRDVDGLNQADTPFAAQEESSQQNQSPEGLREEEAVNSGHLQTEALKMCVCPMTIKKEVEDARSPTKGPIAPFPQLYMGGDLGDAADQEPALGNENAVDPPATEMEEPMAEEAGNGGQLFVPTEVMILPSCVCSVNVKEEVTSPMKGPSATFPQISAGNDQADTAQQEYRPAAVRVENTSGSNAGETGEMSLASLLGDPQPKSVPEGHPNTVENNDRNVFSTLANTRKRPAPGTGGIRRPTKKRYRLLNEESSDSESDADFALDDDSDDDMDSVEEEEEEDGEERDAEEDEVAVDIVAPKHTPFCSKTCIVQHHKLLLSLLRCSNYNYGSTYVNTFMEQVDEYVGQLGKSSDARANGDIPDPVASFKYPLVHWVCVLGKIKVLERLADKKEFDVTVRSRRTGETGLHRMLMSLDRAMVWKKSPLKAILEVFSKTLRILTDADPVVITAANSEGDTPFHCLAKVILDCTGELEKLNCYEGYFERLVHELTRLKTAGKLTPQIVRELLLKTNNSQDTFLHILACRDGVGHRVIKSVLQNIEPEIMDVLKKTVNGYGKTPSDLAEALNSYEMAEILRSQSQILSTADSVQFVDDDSPEMPVIEDVFSEQPEPMNSPPRKLFHKVESITIPEGPSTSGVHTAVNTGSIVESIRSQCGVNTGVNTAVNTSPKPEIATENFLLLLLGKFEEEMTQAQRGLHEKEAALVRVRQRINDAQERRTKLLEELQESVEEIVTATREEGVTLSEIATKKRDIERFKVELAKKAKYETQLKTKRD